eukprot:CAMPEP_0172198982 /NCGR_PEP_ID=MMETSP1050-20130122/28418_1 /TAXON_ID=233186 /ORGANISM="Cryptomonas curvata, Strain CCAP979/52" /LENGTH=53 /DNA_ID=CAMNT_0012875921 /DNA_START=492 /DNA_END=649 /DNA_ORIENTATION=+
MSAQENVIMILQFLQTDSQQISIRFQDSNFIPSIDAPALYDTYFVMEFMAVNG